jgi:hypothetical protein
MMAVIAKTCNKVSADFKYEYKHTQTAHGKNPDTDKKMWSLGHRKLIASPAQRAFRCLEGNNH